MNESLHNVCACERNVIIIIINNRLKSSSFFWCCWFLSYFISGKQYSIKKSAWKSSSSSHHVVCVCVCAFEVEVFQFVCLWHVYNSDSMQRNNHSYYPNSHLTKRHWREPICLFDGRIIRGLCIVRKKKQSLNETYPLLSSFGLNRRGTHHLNICVLF